jgi:hypothetical protein
MDLRVKKLMYTVWATVSASIGNIDSSLTILAHTFPVFFVLLTNTWPFDGVQEKDARRMIREGQRPPIKNELRESKDPAHKALLQAMNMTWKQNPGERATAKEVADYFEVELKKIGVKGLD